MTWSTPTTYLQRFRDAVALLCAGQVPDDKLLLEWLDDSNDSFELQEFAIKHGPEWAQGIVVLDAAAVLADEPTEGVEHETWEAFNQSHNGRTAPGGHLLSNKAYLLMTAEQLGHMLRTSRKHQKLTQAEVALHLGLSQNRVSYLELHPDELSVKQLMAWCAAVGLELHVGARAAEATPAKTEW